MDVIEAEREINKILQKLERDTKSLVKSIALGQIEVTSIMDDVAQFEVSVAIELERTPGHRWNSV